MNRSDMARGDGRTYLGWTEENWAVIAGQMPYGIYAPTNEGAVAMKLAWMTSKVDADLTRRDPYYARSLFENVMGHNARHPAAYPAAIVHGVPLPQ